jgi:Zn-dependent M28 family amino/carboxypeptidase
MRRNILFVFLFTTHILFSQNIAKQFSNQISSDSIRQFLYTLASDSMQGRETGRPGQKSASRFLISKYDSWNLIPGGNKIASGNSLSAREKSFLQDHTINLRNNKDKNLTVNGESFLFGKDFIYSGVTTDTILSISEMLFIGAGQNANIEKTLNSDRYSQKDLILKDRDEQTSDLIRTVLSSHKKVSSLFIITNTESVKQYFITNTFPDIQTPFPVFYITEDVAQKLFPPEKFEKVNEKINRHNKVFVKELSPLISVRVVSNDELLRGQNVIAFIPGRDTNQTIIISSHYDHLGIRDSLIYHGADDNASGTSAVLEIARVFKAAANAGNLPGRNLLFLNVSGEEKGLLGSAWFTSNPTIPIENIVADLNIDMIGRIDSIHDSTGIRKYVFIIGSDKLSTELHEINIAQNDSGPRLELNYKYNSSDDPNHFYTRSDHYNFAKKNIPIIFYFDGKHADYHKPSDTPDKIDFDLLSIRARLVFLTAWELANRSTRITVDKSNDLNK